MKKIVFILFLSSPLLSFAQSLSASFSKTLTSPGLTTSDSLEDGSDWGIIEIKDKSATCADYASQEYKYYKNKTVYIESYVDMTTTCDTATHVYDPYHKALWIEYGTIQLESFGLETIYCTPTGSCEFTKSTTSYNLVYDNISPTSGEDGTYNANGYIYSSYIGEMKGYSIPGKGGSAGNADLTLPSYVTNYCYNVTDVNTVGVSEDECKTPYVEIDKIVWNAISQSGSTLSGASVAQSKKIRTFDGLDESVLYLLEKGYNQ